MDVRQLLVACLAVGGCAEWPTVRVWARDSSGTRLRDDLPGNVLTACYLVGVTCVPEDGTAYGVWAVDLVPTTGSVRGTTTKTFCRAYSWSLDDELYLAHELGHALGLEHREGDDALMSDFEVGSSLNVEEEKQVDRGAVSLGLCK